MPTEDPGGGEVWLEHSGGDDEVGEDEGGHAEGEEDGSAGIGMEGRIEELFGGPVLGRERNGGGGVFIVADESDGGVESGGGGEEGAGKRVD